MTSRPLDVVIVGGGLAGLATAGYLREQHNVTVLEKYPLVFEENVKNDYGMSIVANAYKLLHNQGVKEEDIQAVLFTHLWDRNEKNDNSREFVFDTRRMFGAPSIFVRRSRLQAELHHLATDPSRPGKPAKIISDVIVQSVDPIAGIIVTQTGETYKGDLIVGADGLNSCVRAAVLAHSSQNSGASAVNVSEGTSAIPSGLVSCVTSVPAEVVTSDPVLAFQAAEGVGGICTWRGPEGSKLKVLCYPLDNKSYFQVFGWAPETLWVEDFEKNKSSIIADVPIERVMKEFTDFHPSVKKMLSHSPTLSVRRIRDIDPLDTWTAGKTVLIGDASHATTPHIGQGCNIAIEDAEALGYLFRDVSISAPSELPDPEITSKLEIFQALRTKRAHIVQFASRHAGGMLKGEIKEKAGEFDRAAFSKMIYGYSGFEAVYKAYLAEKEK